MMNHNPSLSATFQEHPHLSIHNVGSTVSELYELRIPYMILYESLHHQDNECLILTMFPNSFSRTVSPIQSYPFTGERALHRHDFFEFVLVLSGVLYQRIEDKSYQYHAGQACLLNKNIRHCEEFSSDFEAVFFMLTDEILNHLIQHDVQYSADGTSYNHFGSIYHLIQQNQRTKYYESKDYIDFTPLNLSPKQNEKLFSSLHSIINTMIEETAKQRPGCIFIIEGMLSRLFSLVEDTTLYQKSSNSLSGSTEEFLLTKIGHILETRHGRISRKELEEITNYNSDYLNRIVKKYTGMTLKEYGMVFCLKDAKYLLQHSNKNISEIVYELGFSNRSYFYQVFHQRYHMTPKQYRDQKLTDKRL